MPSLKNGLSRETGSLSESLIPQEVGHPATQVRKTFDFFCNRGGVFLGDSIVCAIILDGSQQPVAQVRDIALGRFS